jgi:hypothetical protein
MSKPFLISVYNPRGNFVLYLDLTSETNRLITTEEVSKARRFASYEEVESFRKLIGSNFPLRSFGLCVEPRQENR